MFKFALQWIFQDNFLRDFRDALVLQRLQKRHKRQEFLSVEIFPFFFRLIFSSSESYFLKYKKFYRVSVSWKIRNFWAVSISRNKRKVFFWENIKHFLILEPESSISRNISKLFRGCFSLFVFIFQAWVKEVY